MLMNMPYPVIDLKKTGENIKRLREARCISVVDLQYFLGLASPVSMDDILVPQESSDSGNANAPKVRTMQLSTKKAAIAMVAM